MVDDFPRLVEVHRHDRFTANANNAPPIATRVGEQATEQT